MEESLNLCGYICDTIGLPDTDIKTVSPLTMAFMGDCVYDLIIRTLVIRRCESSVEKMHKLCSDYVKAASQMKMYKLVEDVLNEEEITAFKRGRNSKPHSKAKSASKSQYMYATGFEAMLGYLYFTGNVERIVELVKLGLERLENTTE